MRNHSIAGKTSGISGTTWLVTGCILVAVCSLAVAGDRGPRSRTTVSREFYEGRELFIKVWEPGKPSPIGGDGLGPLYNEQSCVGCHHLGGVGGAGGNDRNVLMLTPVASPTQEQRAGKLFLGDLEDLHPGFRGGSSPVIHHHATAEAIETRLSDIRSYNLVDSHGEILALKRSTRNTPALFGAGLIDAIPDRVLLAAAERKFSRFPEIKGRVSRLPDSRIGRFGWKGQTATLRDFVLAACSNELGLEVPGHHQASLAPAQEVGGSRPKLDLDAEPCNQLVQYMRELPPPVLRTAFDAGATLGYPIFESIGCATCHVTKLGSVDGLYSDLLLHDLGDRISDSGGYGVAPPPGGFRDLAVATGQPRSSGEAGPTEWRTPPLWGIADSAPYLHDGRAGSLDEAIRLHGGEAAATSSRYMKLTSIDGQDLLAFLHSLTAAPKPRKHSAAAARRAAQRAKQAAHREVKTEGVEIPRPSGEN